MLSPATQVSRWACPIVFVVSAAAPDITPTRDRLVLIEAGDAITAAGFYTVAAKAVSKPLTDSSHHVHASVRVRQHRLFVVVPPGDAIAARPLLAPGERIPFNRKQRRLVLVSAL